MSTPAPTPDLVVPYKRVQRPQDPNSLALYYDNELRKIEATIQSIIKAIVQLQSFTGV